MKVDAWRSITMEINAVGLHERTISEVKIKWQNIQASSKRSFAETQRHVRQTGGVPPPKTLDLVSEQIVDMMKNTASCVCLEGQETTISVSDGVYLS
jgi:hypothetical protein